MSYEAAGYPEQYQGEYQNEYQGGKGEHKTVSNPTNVVYFSVSNPMYKVDVAMMHDVFSRHGTPLKIYIFNKDGHPQGFCELQGVDEARSVVDELHKKFLFDGGANQLTMKLTTRKSLTVKGNDGNNWDVAAGKPPMQSTDDDYTQPPPPQGKGRKGRQAGGKGSGPPTSQGYGYNPYPQQHGYDDWDNNYNQGYGHQSGGRGQGKGRHDDKSATTPVVLFNGLPTITDTTGRRVVTTDSLFVLCGCYGDVVKVKFLKEPTQALVEMTSVRQAETVRMHLDKLVLFGTPIRAHGATNDNVSKTKGQVTDVMKYWEYHGSKLHRFTNAKSYDNIACPKPTLVVWGYPDGYPEADLLLVFANYGTIEAYKVGPQGNSGQMLLIQLETTDQATVCLLNLHDLAVSGDGGKTSNLRINFAKENIHTPSEDHPQTFCNVIVKGLPEDFTNEQLFDLFSPYGNMKRHTIWKDKTTSKSKGFGLVDYSSVEEAKAAIHALHGTLMPGGTAPLQVSSKYI
eukprot:TRINITY_DN2906_c0_g1_i1.p1 TRINITY_DN2906_c0_g1~~TRINITY_DN2906_c0_g1_i1.p1  ORF type:complete len:536 (+),score=142.31 TRINITY_DN2906_c0_g1_i1:75-1610(+)